MTTFPSDIGKKDRVALLSFALFIAAVSVAIAIRAAAERSHFKRISISVLSLFSSLLSKEN